MDYQAKREVVQAIRVEVACTVKAGGTTLTAKKGDWLIFQGGKPIEALTDAEFGKRYEPVGPARIGTPIHPSAWPLIGGTKSNTTPSITYHAVDHAPAFTSGYMVPLTDGLGDQSTMKVLA